MLAGGLLIGLTWRAATVARNEAGESSADPKRPLTAAGIPAPARQSPALERELWSRPPRFVAVAGGAGADAAPGAATPGAGSPPRPPEVLGLDRRHDLTVEELRKLALNCEVRLDVPGMKTTNDIPKGWMERKDLERIGLSVREMEVAWTALERHRREVNELFRGFYLTATGDAAGARELDAMDLNRDSARSRRLVEAVKDDSFFSEGARVVAEELAGMRPPGRAEGEPPAAAVYRRQLALADEFESRLAAELGPARARALRRQHLSGQTRRAWCR